MKLISEHCEAGPPNTTRWWDDRSFTDQTRPAGPPTEPTANRQNRQNRQNKRNQQDQRTQCERNKQRTKEKQRRQTKKESEKKKRKKRTTKVKKIRYRASKRGKVMWSPGGEPAISRNRSRHSAHSGKTGGQQEILRSKATVGWGNIFSSRVYTFCVDVVAAPRTMSESKMDVISNKGLFSGQNQAIIALHLTSVVRQMLR